MGDSAIGLAGLAFLALLVGSLVMSSRRHSPREVITPGVAKGRVGLAVHPWRGHWLSTVTGWVLVAAVAAVGAGYLERSPVAGGFLLACSAALAYIGWARSSGRAGDGTLTLTPQGIHQLYGGSEVFVPWDDVQGLVITPTDLIVQTRRPVVPVHHMLPLVGGRRGVATDHAIGLPRKGLPPLPYSEMIALYATTPAARGELATDEVVHRARGMLVTSLEPMARDPRSAVLPAGQGGPPAGGVRRVVEFTLQLVGWVFLAISGGSLYLLVTTGSAPAIGSTPLALTVFLGAGLLIWATRRSLYKKQYRGY